MSLLSTRLSPVTQLAILLLTAVLGGAAGGCLVYALDQLRMMVLEGHFIVAWKYLHFYWRPGAILGLITFLAFWLRRFLIRRRATSDQIPTLSGHPAYAEISASQLALAAGLIASAGLWLFAVIRHHLIYLIDIFGPVGDGYPTVPLWQPVVLCLVFALPAIALASGLRRLSRLSWPICLWLAFLPFAISVTLRAHGQRDTMVEWQAWAISVCLIATLARSRREQPRALFATLTGLVVLVSLVGAWSQRPQVVEVTPPDRRSPNILFLVVDTLRFDIFRQVVAETPEGQRFAQAMSGAAWFEQTFATGPWTAPSMGSLLTGLYPEEHGLRSAGKGHGLHPLAGSVPTLAEKLQAQGYWTEAIVSNPLLIEPTGVARGFHRYRVYTGPTHRLSVLGTLERLGWIAAEYYQNADILADAFQNRLPEVLELGRPFFFWVHFLDPHTPLKKHDDLPWLKPTRRKLPRPSMVLYRDEVRFVLREIAALLEDLKRQGLFENTMIVFVSDHGEMLSIDGRSSPPLAKKTGHGHSVYQELMHVPLIVRPAGGLPEGRSIQNLVSLVDIHDTVLDLAEIDVARIGFDRRSLAPWLGRTAPAETHSSRAWAYGGSVQMGDPQYAFVSNRSKLILHEGPRRPELFDLETDHKERQNLAQEQPERVNQLRQELSVIRSQLRPADQSQPLDFDDETRRQLEALGYLGGGATKDPEPPNP